MSRFYFTYGEHGQPYQGGWTEVEAPNMKAAIERYTKAHPESIYCNIYTSTRFMETRMYRYGNFGKRCHEILFFNERKRVNE